MLDCTQNVVCEHPHPNAPYESWNIPSIARYVTHSNKEHYVWKINYIVQAEKHIALPNQRYLWFVSVEFLYFFTNYKQGHRLENAIKFDSLVWLTF